MRATRRIGFDARYISDTYHGIGRYAFQLLTALATAAPDHTFVVFRGNSRDTRFNWTALEERKNVEFRRVRLPLYWPQEQLLWPLVLTRAGIDLFHSPYFVAPLLAGVPILLTIHDLIFERYPEYMPRAWGRPYYRALMKASVRKAQRIVTISQATAADMLRFYPGARAKIEIVLSAHDSALRPVSDARELTDLCRRYDLQHPFVLLLGARRPHKNLARFVTAYGKIAGRTEFALVHAGPRDGRFSDDATRVATEANLGDRVRFLGWVPEADLAGLYTLAGVFAQPSLVEGFGLPALEAMACGTPVIASNASAIAEVVGQAGLLVDPLDVNDMADGLLSLLLDVNLRERLATAGKERAAQFDWNQAAQRLLQIYDQVLG